MHRGKWSEISGICKILIFRNRPEVLEHFILDFCLLERFEEVKEFPVGCYKK